MDTCSNHLLPTNFAGKCRAFQRVFLPAMHRSQWRSISAPKILFCSFSCTILVQQVSSPCFWLNGQAVLVGGALEIPHLSPLRLGIRSWLGALQWLKQYRNVTPCRPGTSHGSAAADPIATATLHGSSYCHGVGATLLWSQCGQWLGQTPHWFTWNWYAVNRPAEPLWIKLAVTRDLL